MVLPLLGAYISGAYEALRAYTEGEAVHRFPSFEYPAPDFRAAGRHARLDVGEAEVRALRPDW